MNCGKCGKANEPQARFCQNCGASLQGTTCPKCGQANEAGSAFCNQCGQALGQPLPPPVVAHPAAPPPPRKHVWRWIVIGLVGIFGLGAVAFLVLAISAGGLFFWASSQPQPANAQPPVVLRATTTRPPAARPPTLTPRSPAVANDSSNAGAPTVSVSKDTNCRTGPGEPYPSVGGLMVGQSAEVVGRSPGGDFWIIENPYDIGNTCWLWKQYATVTGDASGLPIIQPPPLPEVDPRIILSSLASRQAALTITVTGLDSQVKYSILIDPLNEEGLPTFAEGGCSISGLPPEYMDAYGSYVVLWTTPPCTEEEIVAYWGNYPADPDVEALAAVTALEISVWTDDGMILVTTIQLP